MASEKEILDALYTLRSVCADNMEKCSNCILRNNSDTCGVLFNSDNDSYYSLKDWNLKDPDKPRIIMWWIWGDYVKHWSGNDFTYRGYHVKNNKKDGYLEVYDKYNQYIFRINNVGHGSVTEAKVRIDAIKKDEEG